MIPRNIWREEGFDIDGFLDQYEYELLSLKARAEELIVNNHPEYEMQIAIWIMSQITSYESTEELSYLLESYGAELLTSLVVFVTCENLVNKGLLRKVGNNYILNERVPIDE